MRRTTRIIAALVLLSSTIGFGEAAAGPTGGALPPQLVRRLQVAGEYGVPTDAAMIAANVTAVNGADNGFLTVYPCDEAPPETSNVNYVANQIAPNLVLARLSAAGAICISTLEVADIIVDLVGYVPAGSTVTPLATPERIFDSRDNSPDKVPAGSTTQIPIDTVGVPDDANLALFNATAVAGGDPGFLTFFPCGSPLPDTSSVNFLPQQVVPNFTAARIGANRSICVFNLAPAHIIVDLAATATSGITAIENPVRLYDSRSTAAKRAEDTTLTVSVTDAPAVPDSATAALYNLTSVGSTAPGFATSHPCDEARPDASNLNYAPGQIVANGSITKLSKNGELCIFTLAETHLIVDLVGYTEGTSDYMPLTPTRIWDTRQGWQRTCDWTVSRVDHTLIFWNLATQERRTITLAAFGEFLGPFYLPEVTCDSALLATQASESSPGGIYRVDLNASISQIADVPYIEGFGPIRDLAFDGEGFLGIEPSGDVWDLSKASRLLAVSGTDSSFTVADLSTDGTTIVLNSFDSTRARTDIVSVDVQTGEALGSVSLDHQVAVSVSTDGQYFSVHQTSESNRFISSREVKVFTRFGDLVETVTLPSPDFPEAFLQPRHLWTGSGELLICQGHVAVYTYPVFGALSVISDGEIYLVGSPNEGGVLGCPLPLR